MSELSRRDRRKLPPVPVPERRADERRDDFDEVTLGYGPDEAMAEAARCLLCARPSCIEGCPVGVDINDFVRQVAAGDFDAAAGIVAADNPLPAVCGRVCPQERQCEGACVLARKGTAVRIGQLERFVGDHARAPDHDHDAGPVPISTGHRVAVIGSGPSGLACAGDLARLGHEVTVFEALHELGGVLAYGIPEFRLPRSVVAGEIERLRSLGVDFRTNTVIGPGDTLDDLVTTEGFDAVFVGVGAGLPRFLDVAGEELVGVYSANEFLTRINLMNAYRDSADTPILDMVDRRVAVVGAGNTALDAARTALRLGAGEVTVLYRRTRAEMPARAEELGHAEDEGVVVRELVAPVEFLGDDESRLVGMRVQTMVLGEPDEDGRHRPEPGPGAPVDEPVDVVVVAVGNTPNPLLARSAPELQRTPWGTLVVDPETGATSVPGVFAGGDIVTGGATVVLAIGAGRRAAVAIDRWLGQDGGTDPDPPRSEP